MDIKEMFSAWGVKLYRHKNIYVGCCPFHEETSPSLIVDPAKNSYICLSCGAYGTSEDGPEEENAETCADPQRKDRVTGILRMAAEYYCVRLAEEDGQKGLDYFLNRGLTGKTIDQFLLGHAPGYGDHLIRFLEKNGVSKKEILEAGLAVEKDGKFRDRFYDRVMFPLTDEDGNIVGFTGRAIDPEGAKKMKYFNSPESPYFKKRELLFGLDKAKNSESSFFILVEGNMDVIALHQAGFDNAVASCGTALTASQCQLLKQYKDKVLLMYDADGPGIASSVKAARLLGDADLRTAVTDASPYKDPDELIKAEGAEGIQERIRKAMPAGKFLIRMSDADKAVDHLLLYVKEEELKAFI